MTNLPTLVLSARGRLGYAKRSGDPEAIIAARRELAAANIAAYAARVVADAPPLTPAQCDLITAMLHQSGGALN